MNFLGLYRHVHSSHAKSLTGEMFVSLGMNAMSGRDIYAEGGLIALAEGRIANREKLSKLLKLPSDAPGSMIVNRAYRMWGADYPRRIEGSAVTAVIDRAEERLILACDRMGATPVFYAWRGRSAAFASHPDYLLRAGVSGRNVDKAGLRELFFSGGIYTPGRTPFRDIRMLEAGSVLIADGRGTRIKRYAPVSDLILAESVESEGDFDEMLFSAVKAIDPDAKAVLLSDGLSFRAADALSGKQEVHAYHLAFRDENKIPRTAENGGFFYEEHEYALDDAVSALGEVNLALGLPGLGIRDARMLFFMRKVFEKEKCAFMGGRIPAEEENLSIGKFLKPEISRKLGEDTYFEDRFNDAMDRFHIPLDEEKGEGLARRAAAAYTWLPSYFMRVHMLSACAGGKAFSLLMDRNVAAKSICGDETEIGRGRKKISSASDTEQMISAVGEILKDASNPVSPLIDDFRVKEAMEKGETEALSRLIGVNLWLSQYEAEILPF